MYKKFVLAVFFVGYDPNTVVEDHMSLITLHPNSLPTASNTCTTLGFANRMQDLAAFVPEGQKYPEGILLSRIRARLPAYVKAKLTEIEMHNKTFLTTFDLMKPVLERIDAKFQTDKAQKDKGQRFLDKTKNHSPKRKAHDAALTSMQASKKGSNHQTGGKQNPSYKLDKRPSCTHCKKPGHNESTCWIKYPEKRPNYKPRNGPDSTSVALQALAAQVAALTAASNK